MLLDAAWSLTLALAITGPLWLGRGFWLVGDMVFVPHQPWKDAWLGLDGSLPRAVPMDALISVASHVLPGQVLQRLLLSGGLVVGGIGVGRMAGRHGGVARAAAIALFCWNPWVAERLGIGQWAILLGYLLLPWVALAARRLREDRNRWAPAALTSVLAATCSPSNGVMAAVTLLVLAGGRRTWWRIVAIALVANLAWLAPAITATTSDVTTTGVFAGFAARAESSAGVLPSLLSLGGIWKTSILLEPRTSSVVVLLSCLLSLVALLGLVPWSRQEPGEARRLGVLGAGALVVALLPDLPGGDRLLEDLAAPVPGLALLRDSHRFLAPLGLVLAAGLAGAVTEVRGRIRPNREALRGVVGLLVVAPVLLLPTLGWGLGGDLQRSSYPPAWEVVARRLAEVPGTTVVLPWTGSYRAFPWAHDRAVLDPAPRALPGEVLVDDRTYLTDQVVPAEDPRSDAIRVALSAADPVAALRGLHVRWVLVEAGLGARPTVEQLHRHGATTAYDADGLVLVDLGPSERALSTMPLVAKHRDFVLFCDVSVLLLLLVSTAWILRDRM
ncbi:hypothetical protein GCM10028801_20390 [Nocardioides maradonensis]